MSGAGQTSPATLEELSEEQLATGEGEGPPEALSPCSPGSPEALSPRSPSSDPVKTAAAMSPCSDTAMSEMSDTEPEDAAHSAHPKPGYGVSGAAKDRRERRKRAKARAKAKVKNKHAATSSSSQAYRPSAISELGPAAARRRRKQNLHVRERCHAVGETPPVEAETLPSLPARLHPGHHPEQAIPASLPEHVPDSMVNSVRNLYMSNGQR